MRTKCTTLYAFDELSDCAKAKAITQFWDINVNDSDWYDFLEDDIDELARLSGLGCRYGNEFDLERARYVSIVDCSIGVGALRANAEQVKDMPNVYEEVFAPLLATFSTKEWHQLERLERTGYLGILSGQTNTYQHGVSADVERFDTGWHPYVCALIDRLEKAWTEFLRNLEQCYLTMLQKEYEYQTSEEQIIESIVANGYEFLSDGTWER